MLMGNNLIQPDKGAVGAYVAGTQIFSLLNPVQCVYVRTVLLSQTSNTDGVTAS